MTDYDDDQAPAPAEEFADFDAFYAEAPAPERTGQPFTLYGRTWRLPSRVGALFMLQLHRLRSSEQPEDVQALVGALFGPDALGHFTANGMDDEQFETLLIWGMANAQKPEAMTIAQAVAERTRLERAEAQRGKAAARPSSAKPRKPKAKKRAPSSGAPS